MKIKWSIIWLSILLLGLAGCNKEKNGMEIVSVTYTAESGMILPELQWHEEILVTRNRAVLSRNGKTGDSRVNAGSWEISLEAQKATYLFDQLQAVDCSKIKRIEPKEAPEGGGTASYVINFSNGKSCTLFYDPGATYANGEAVTTPIDGFIRSISFPADALRQFTP